MLAAESLRSTGIALLAAALVFHASAWVAAYFRQWPIPSDPLEQLTIIAHDRVGWTAQAILFPVIFLATTLIFGVMASRLPLPLPRLLAIAAAVLFAAGFLFWLPIAADRLALGARAADMLRSFDPADPPIVMGASWSFWPNTLSILTAIFLMGAALGSAGVLPRLGWIVAGLAAAGIAIGVFVMRDWPPFMSYILLLVLAIGLMRSP